MKNFLLSGSQSCQGLEVSEAARGTASSQTLLWEVPSRGSTLRGGGKATHPTFKYTCKFVSLGKHHPRGQAVRWPRRVTHAN